MPEDVSDIDIYSRADIENHRVFSLLGKLTQPIDWIKTI